jgi:hypothetical protein
MVIRKDILLNECGDVKIENGDTVLIDGPDQIRQSWLIHMRTLQGELVTNVNIGMPWFQENGILGKHQDLTAVEEFFHQGTLEVPGVIRVNGIEIKAFDINTRTYEINVDCTIESDEGEEAQVFNYQGVIPPST